MATYILTSMFPKGFDEATAKMFDKVIQERGKFAFVASDFVGDHQRTDEYFQLFYEMFLKQGIMFQEAYVVDGRMTPAQAAQALERADVVWLSGGDTLEEYRCLQEYGLIKVLRAHQGVIIGMSAGTLNLAKTTICTRSLGHDRQEIYEGLGCVDITVESHFEPGQISDEIMELSVRCPMYEMCDNSYILCQNGEMEFYGEIYLIHNKIVKRLC